MGGCSRELSGGDIGTVLPPTPLHGVNGELRDLSEWRGTPLVINVWASWCAPCRAEMGSLEALSRAFPPDRLRVIGVSTDRTLQPALDFMARSGVSFPNFHDADGDLGRRVFGADGLPLTLVVDAQGKIVERVIGARDWKSAQSIALIESALGRSLR